MSCAIFDWFVCFLFPFSTLGVVLKCCLIFCNVFERFFPDFGGLIPYFCVFWFVHFCLGTTSSFFALSICSVLILSVCHAFEICWASFCNVFSGVVEVFLLVLLVLVYDFYGAKIGVLYQFMFGHFAFFVYFFAIVFACAFDTFILKPLSALTYQNYAYCPLCSVFWPAQC